MFKPNFQITPTILSAISEISGIKAVVERSRVLPLNEAHLRRQAIVRMAHTSTSIEGNELAEYQVGKVIEGQKVNADQKSIKEVKNYYDALQEMEMFTKERQPMTLDQILKFHALIVRDLLDEKKTGHFRPGSVYIVDDLGQGKEKVKFEGPPAAKVPFLVNELLGWVRSQEDLHPVILAGLFHSQFVHIHPFADGNGRITRLLTTKILYERNWDFRRIIVLEDFYNRDRQAYYNALSQGWPVAYQEGVDFTPWLEYFVHGFLAEAKRVYEDMQSMGLDRVSSSGEQVFIDKDEARIIDFVVTTGRLVSNDVQDILGIAKRTAQLKLKSLVEKGMLRVHGRGPGTYYTLSGA